MNRFEKWELNLGIYETSQQQSIENQRKTRFEQYQKLVMNTKTNEDMKEDIMKDINRTYQEMDVFHQEENKTIMCNVLFIWCSSELSYRQGMNEIIGVLFFTYQQCNNVQEIEKLKVENDIYWVFKTIMDDGGHKEVYNYSANIPIDKTPIIRRIKDLIQNKLRQIDEQLYLLFEQNQISSEIFLIRWIKCLLAREYDIDQIQLIWDKLFERFRTHRLKYLDAIILAMIIALKSQIFKIECVNNFEVLMLFQNYPSKDQYQTILSDADHILHQLVSKTSWNEIIKRFNIIYILQIILSQYYR